MNFLSKTFVTTCISLLACHAAVYGQLAPEIGYVHPAGIQAGTTVDVILGGYDWTDDMQFFVEDSRVKMELLGGPTPVLMGEPPYWFGAKARGYAWPLPREFRARLTVLAEVPSGFVRWQVANANGVSPPGVIQIGSIPDVLEAADRERPQVLPQLPVAVSGQIRCIEQIDRYQICPQNDGPVTLELIARQLTSPTNPMSLHAIVQVHDETGRRIVDFAASEGHDFTRTFAAQAQHNYVISLHDLDFAGDRSYVYRLLITRGPSLSAAYPAAGQRGETRMVEFVGWGVATGEARLESVMREVRFPADLTAEAFEYTLQTPFGNSKPFSFALSTYRELVEGTPFTEVPAAVTGMLDVRFGSDVYPVSLKKGDVWQIFARSHTAGLPPDLELNVVDKDDKELATVDDIPGSTDCELNFVVPEDGIYRFVVTDRSGHSGDRTACYRLSFEKPRDDFSITVADRLSLLLGSTAKLPVTIARTGGFKGPVHFTFEGLPEGITTPAELVIPDDKNNLVVDLSCAAESPASARQVRIIGKSVLQDGSIVQHAKTLVIAATMKPRIKITPEGLDDVSKVRRGSTHLFPLIVERLEGFEGGVTLEMTSKQQRHRQGLASDEFIVEPAIKRVEYPIFVPEWMETTKTSRMILNGAVRVADPKGTVRTLLQRMELRLGLLPEGALLKLTSPAIDLKASLGSELLIPIIVSHAPEFRETVLIELVPSESQAGLILAESISLMNEETKSTLSLRLVKDAKLLGEQRVTLRATALQDGKWLVKSEITLTVEVRDN